MYKLFVAVRQKGWNPDILVHEHLPDNVWSVLHPNQNNHNHSGVELECWRAGHAAELRGSVDRDPIQRHPVVLRLEERAGPQVTKTGQLQTVWTETWVNSVAHPVDAHLLDPDCSLGHQLRRLHLWVFPVHRSLIHDFHNVLLLDRTQVHQLVQDRWIAPNGTCGLYVMFQC